MDHGDQHHHHHLHQAIFTAGLFKWDANRLATQSSGIQSARPVFGNPVLGIVFTSRGQASPTHLFLVSGKHPCCDDVLVVESLVLVNRINFLKIWCRIVSLPENLDFMIFNHRGLASSHSTWVSFHKYEDKAKQATKKSFLRELELYLDLGSVEKQTSLIHIHHRNAEFGRDKVRRASISSPKQTCPRSLGANQVDQGESGEGERVGREILPPPLFHPRVSVLRLWLGPGSCWKSSASIIANS
ncbi:hypothetical protein SAY87_006886 [Trapa incisa]|uniref:Uncharacterized protein n=1 Tax=Trapa incisa TaxID=236973 RepID=A0AAN7K033_9MYRT|nr:hypothetical protein SAY87_006886 [Trapa incisa]